VFKYIKDSKTLLVKARCSIRDAIKELSDRYDIIVRTFDRFSRKTYRKGNCWRRNVCNSVDIDIVRIVVLNAK
jgi:hypothetical protein